MHGIKGECEAWPVQESLQSIKVKDGAHQLQVIFHWVYHLNSTELVWEIIAMQCDVAQFAKLVQATDAQQIQ